MQARSLLDHPKKNPEIDWEKARRVLGEQIVGRIAMIARHVACIRPGCKVPFSDSSRITNAEWTKSFFAYLVLPSKTKVASQILSRLGKDLTCWVKKHSADAKETSHLRRPGYDRRSRRFAGCTPVRVQRSDEWLLNYRGEPTNGFARPVR
jgi:hypothetical protein